MTAPKPLGALAYATWIGLAVVTQAVLAVWAILSRYLQTKPDQPAPTLRLVLVVSSLAEATLLLFHTLPTTAAGCYQRHCRAPAAAVDGSSTETSGGKASDKAAAAAAAPLALQSKAVAGGEASLTLARADSGLVAAVHDGPVAAGVSELLAAAQQREAELPVWQAPQLEAAGAATARAATQAAAEGTLEASTCSTTPLSSRSDSTGSLDAAATPAAAVPNGSSGGDAAAAAAGAPARRSSWARALAPGSLRALLARRRTMVRPEVPMRRGLSMRFAEMEAARPALSRWLALATLTLSFTGTVGLQLCAPGFVDPSIVQLVGQFSAIGTALAQGVLLRHRLPWSIWPCTALMTAGAAMVIVPSMGHTESGSLGTTRGWIGFGLAVAALFFTIVYFVTLQATRHMGYTATQLQHVFLSFSILLFLLLSLPIDGTDWSAQFSGWTAGDWVLLAFESSVAYVGSATAMQYCVWKLGASLVALFLGLRLVFSAVLTAPILGTTVIQTPVQIAGIVVTAGAVTLYVLHQWWAGRKAAAAATSGTARR